MWYGSPRQIEGTHDVGVYCPPKHFGAEACDVGCLQIRPARIVDQDIQTTHTIYSFIDELLAESFVTDIARNGEDLRIGGRFDDRSNIIGVRLLVGQVIDRNVRALSGKSNGYGSSNA